MGEAQIGGMRVTPGPSDTGFPSSAQQGARGVPRPHCHRPGARSAEKRLILGQGRRTHKDFQLCLKAGDVFLKRSQGRSVTLPGQIREDLSSKVSKDS